MDIEFIEPSAPEFASLNLGAFLVPNPISTFYGRVKGFSMQGAGVDDGDLLIIDRSLDWKNGALAVCVLNGGFTLKFIKRENGSLFLVSANPEFPPIKVNEDEDNFNVFGVVSYVIKPQYFNF